MSYGIHLSYNRLRGRNWKEENGYYYYWAGLCHLGGIAYH